MAARDGRVAGHRPPGESPTDRGPFDGAAVACPLPVACRHGSFESSFHPSFVQSLDLHFEIVLAQDGGHFALRAGQ